MLCFREKKTVFSLLLLICTFALIIAFRWEAANSSTAVSTAAEPYYHGETGKKAVAFAMNVDWGEDYIPQVLSVLEKQEVKITFFLTGRWSEKFPDVAHSLADAGMEIGNHGLKHNSPNSMSYDENKADIASAEEKIEAATGIRPTLFAPASGERDDQVLEAAEDLGYPVILWSVDTIDWQKPTAEVIVQRVTSKVSDGDIVLMHPTENTVKALPTLIRTLKKEGFHIVTVSELIS